MSFSFRSSRSTLHLSPLLDRPQSWIFRYSSKWGSQGTMALPKNANAVIHPSFGKIQLQPCMKWTRTRLMVRHNRPMTDKCNRRKAPVDCSSIPCPSSFHRNVDPCKTTCMKMEMAGMCASQLPSRPIFLQQRHKSGVFIDPLQLKAKLSLLVN
jgi:hypothetical protein